VIASVLRRLRTFSGSLGLLALLALAASLLLTATPHLANRYTDQGLRDWVDSLGYRVRDVSYLTESDVSADPTRPTFRPSQAYNFLGGLHSALPTDLRGRLGGEWYSTQITEAFATGDDLPVGYPAPQLSVRDQSEAQSSVRMVAGAWPATEQVVEAPLQAAVSAAVASTFNLHVGSQLVLRSPQYGPSAVLRVTIVGVFEPLDPTAPIWAEQEEVLRPYAPLGTDPPEPWRGILLTDARGMSAAAAKLIHVEFAWRFRIDDSALDVASLPTLTTAAFEARRQDVIDATTQTALDTALARYGRQVLAVQALLAVVQAGILATLFGLVILAAMASAQRRRNEFALLRARGSSLATLGGRVLLESTLAVSVAIAVGYLVGWRVPGRPGDTEWIVLVFGGAALLAGPVLAAAGHRRVSFAATRVDLQRPRVSGRRITAELTLVVLAAFGALLLRRRGLGAEVDPYLVVVPVLAAAAAAVVALRLFPYPLRVLASLAARARGAVPFLGFARAGRAAPATAGPLAVLVVAVSVGVFSTAVAGSVAAARDRVADLAVPGDAYVHGGLFTQDTRDAIADAPGVTEVAAVSLEYNLPLAGGSEAGARALPGTAGMIVDAPELARVLTESGVAQTVPDVLVQARRGDGPVPAVVSPSVAADLAGAGSLLVQAYPYPFQVAAVVETFPGLPIGTDRFVVLPWQALVEPAAKPVLPTGFIVAGDGIDPARMAEVGDAGQRAWISSVTGSTVGDLEHPTSVDTHAEVRAQLERGGVDQVLGYTFVVGSAAGVVLALLAVGFSVVTGARVRGQALSRLRTLGLSSGQGRRLLAYELLPLIGLGALVGSVVGAALPTLIGPALGLSAFSDGAPVVLVLDPRLAAVAFGLVVVAVVLAVTIEAMVNRRARLGEVLRVGGESS
jgi:putative ABC transport system permease protein